MRAAFALLLLSIAQVAAAEVMWFEPPDPTAHTPVDVIVKGRWFDTCVPSGSDVSIAGSTITIRMAPSGSGCVTQIWPYQNIVHLGAVPPGKYTVIARLTSPVRGRTELVRRTLVVRDADTLSIAPYAIPTGGAQVQMNVKAPTLIAIDGVPARFSFAGDVAVVDAPPHAAGAVDVTVMQGTTTTVAKAAMIYYDPNDGDPVVFEPILFPIAFEGPGALGSRWTTENSVWLGAMQFRDPVVTGFLPNGTQPWGRVLYARREPPGTFHPNLTLFSSRIRELTRQPYSTGTEVPVVREHDFRGERLFFLNAPVGTNLRVMLRVWSLDPVSEVTYNDGANLAPVPMARVPGTNLYFGARDVTARTGTLVAVGSDTDMPRIWAMITYTDNDTQQVTIVTPHQQ